MKIQLMIVIFTLPVVFCNHVNKYCFIRTCLLGLHTLCMYEEDWPDGNCERVFRFGLILDERKAIIEMHNYFKSKVYQGLEQRGNPGPQPRAINFRFYSWDRELANIAERWTYQCKIDSDWCRNVDRFRVGQNYVFKDYNRSMSTSEEIMHLQQLVASWYHEVQRFDSNDVQNFRRGKARAAKALNYTQMIWGESYRLGCSAIRFQQANYSSPKIFFVCNYGPHGNIDQSPVYETNGDETEDY